jgi:predicted RecA/RadA family phage recombinase
MPTRTLQETRAILFPKAKYPVAKRLAALDDIPYMPRENAPAGAILVLGGRVRIANGNLLAGYRGSLTAVGVFAFPKATGAGTAIPADTDVYWDATAEVVTTDSGGGKLPRAGTTIGDAGDDDATVSVVLGG